MMKLFIVPCIFQVMPPSSDFNKIVRAVYDALNDVQGWTGFAATALSFFGADSCRLAISDSVNGHSWNVATAQSPAIDLANQASGSEAGHVMERALTVTDEITGHIRIERHSSNAEFGRREKSTLERLIPHLENAIRLNIELEACRTQRAAALEGHNRQGTAALIVDETGRLLFANQMAKTLLGVGDCTVSASGRVTAMNAQSATCLRALIANVEWVDDGTPGHSGTYITLPRCDHLPLSVLVCPISPQTNNFGVLRRVALILCRDPELPIAFPVQAFRALFGLSTAEAKLAALLAEGRAIDDIAAEMGISPHTARTQLKHVMGKTNTSRQGELIALVLRSIPAAG